jgi:hypothetical protein
MVLGAVIVALVGPLVGQRAGLPVFWARAGAIVVALLLMYPAVVTKRRTSSLLAWLVVTGAMIVIAFGIHRLLGWS